MIFFLAPVIAVIAVLVPGVAMAESTTTTAVTGFLVSCTTSGNCNTCDFIAQFLVIAELLLKTLSAVSIITIMYGGLLWILSTGNPERVRKGRQVIIGTVIGIFIVFSSYLIVNFTLRAFIGQDFTGQLFGADWGAICKGQVMLAPETTTNSTVGADEELDNDIAPDDECATLAEGTPCETASCPDEGVCFCHNSTCKESCLATTDQVCTDAPADCTDPAEPIDPSDPAGLGGVVVEGNGACLEGGTCCFVSE